MTVRTARAERWRCVRPLHGPVLVLSATLLSCGQQRVPPEPTSVVPPAVSSPSHLVAGDVAPATGALRNPHAGDAAVARSGELLFTAMNCDGCHGGGASGWVGPNLGDGRWRYGGSDAEVFNSIYFGRPRGMPAFGGALGTEGVWTLVTYLRSLPAPPNVPTQSWQN